MRKISNEFDEGAELTIIELLVILEDIASELEKIGYFPLDGMLVHRKVTPQHCDRRYPFIHLGDERQRGIKFLV